MPLNTEDPSQASGRLHVLRQALATPRRFISVWYFAYLFLGIVTAGLVPVLLPLMMASLSHKLATVAYVMGAYNLGLLLSPLQGVVAERRHEYAPLFFAGLLFVGLGVAVMPLVTGLASWFVVAFVIGASSSAAATVASLFVVDFTPRAEWEPRIGWLQSFNGTGQVIGLVLAGIFSSGRFDLGLWIAAAVMVPALIVGGIGLPVGTGAAKRSGKAARPEHPIHHLNFRALTAFPRTSLGVVGLLRHSHHLGRSGWIALPSALHTVFGRFLISWFSMYLGVAAFFAYFPLLMQHGYAVAPAVTSLVYAAAAGVGIALFVMASHWCARHGVEAVYRLGLLVRALGFVLLLAMFFLPSPGRAPIALVSLALIVLAWPILSVSGTNLAASLTTGSEGTAMGMFNASGALATVLGTFAGGPLVRVFGYGVVPVLAIAGLLAALFLGSGLREPDPPGSTRDPGEPARGSSSASAERPA